MLDEIVEAVFGVDFKIGRTVRDTLFQPLRVGEAELDPENKTYTPQIRLFIALFGLQLFAFSFFKLFDFLSLETLFPSEIALTAVTAELEARGSDVETANQAIKDWYNYSIWPATIYGSLIYVLLMKAYRPSLRFSEHLRLYLLPSNAAMVWMTLLFITALILARESWLVVATSFAGMLIFFVYTVPIIARWHATTRLGLGLKVFGLILAAIPSLIITLTVAYTMMSYGMHRETGLGYYEGLALAFQAELDAVETQSKTD